MADQEQDWVTDRILPCLHLNVHMLSDILSTVDWAGELL